jgi:choline kinase
MRTKGTINKNVSAIILAAGFGMRLKNTVPKSLVSIENNKTILDHQIGNLSNYITTDRILIVVGYKKELVMERHPELTFVYNEAYNRTNTGKSLLKALKKITGGDILWLNGDVVFDKKIITKFLKTVSAEKRSCVLVDNKKCGEEEVKYSVDKKGYIASISKSVTNASGEALGINYLVEKDSQKFINYLESIDDNDYFEKAIERMIIDKQSLFKPVKLGKLFCQEVDFPEDLKSVQKHLKTNIRK